MLLFFAFLEKNNDALTKAAKKGHVYATANPIHIGKKTHLWEIKVIDDDSNLISHCKLTTIVVDKK